MSLLLIFPKPWCCRTKPKGHLVQHQQFYTFRNDDSGYSNASRESTGNAVGWWSLALECQTLVCWSASVPLIPLQCLEACGFQRRGRWV